MKTAVKLLSSLVVAGVMATSASADYVAVTWDDNGSINDYLWSDADGYTFTLEEFSDDLRIEADLNGRKLRIDALEGIFVPGSTGPGIYTIDTFDGDDENLIDHSTFFSDQGSDFFQILSIDGTSAIEFAFAISDGSDYLTGTGCIGATCASSPSPVPVPGAAWLFLSAVTGLAGIRRAGK